MDGLWPRGRGLSNLQEEGKETHEEQAWEQGFLGEKTLEEAKVQTGAQKPNLETKVLQTLASVALISWWKREGKTTRKDWRPSNNPGHPSHYQVCQPTTDGHALTYPQAKN